MNPKHAYEIQNDTDRKQRKQKNNASGKQRKQKNNANKKRYKHKTTVTGNDVKKEKETLRCR